MSWFADLAGKAEDMLVNLDEQTGAALRNPSFIKKQKKIESPDNLSAETVWGQKKRPIPRAFRHVPNKKTGLPVSANTIPTKDQTPSKPSKYKTPSPGKRVYSLNNCPKTLVGDVKDADIEVECYGYKPRRLSLPANLSNDCLNYRLENLEVENAMLKNELNVTNREIKELLERLHRTEDELAKTNIKLEDSEQDTIKFIDEKDSLLQQLEQLKGQLNNLTNVEMRWYKDHQRDLESEVSNLREKNKELEDRCKALSMKSKEKDVSHNKAETDLRHANSTINMLQNDLGKSKEECKRLETEWQTYKHRVKNILAAKDKEIKTLQQGITSEETKDLVEQIESLKVEREMLSSVVKRVRGECDDMKKYMEEMENRRTAIERVVSALRGALKDERCARIRAESQCNNLSKELKSIQIETGQTIVNLRNALREKEMEVVQGRSSSTLQTTDSSALNVGDYNRESEEDNGKVYYLTQKLVQKQGRIDLLVSDNNILKIQLEKLEKQKSDLQARAMKKEEEERRNINNHSVVQVQDGVSRYRDQYSTESGDIVCRWFKTLFRRHRVFRVFIFVYVLILHLWVVMILLHNTPDIYNRQYTFAHKSQLTRK